MHNTDPIFFYYLLKYSIKFSGPKEKDVSKCKLKPWFLTTVLKGCLLASRLLDFKFWGFFMNHAQILHSEMHKAKEAIKTVHAPDAFNGESKWSSKQAPTAAF